MINYEISVGDVSRDAIIDEVIGSAARILMLSGFTETEVRNIFLRASSQTGSDSGESDALFMDAKNDEVHESSIEIYDVSERFDNLEAVRALTRLAKRADALDCAENASTLDRAIGIITEAVVLRKESLKWLRTEAGRLRIDVSNSRNQWLQSATDEQLDNEDSVIFLDDYQWSGNFPWQLADQLVRELARSGNRTSLEKLQQILIDNEIAVEDPFRAMINRALGIAGEYKEFQAYVQSYSGTGEQQQSELLDRYMRSSNPISSVHDLELWLEGMSSRGELTRYKRANRWRVTVT